MATGKVVVHLDDDDLLAPNALAKGIGALNRHRDLDLVFLGTKGFGERADHFERVQGKALARVIAYGGGFRAESELIRFGPSLFEVLLETVPIAFQRAMVRRDIWRHVSDTRMQAYMLDPRIPNREAVMRALQPPLRESEWSIYAAAIYKTALLDEPLYLQRCEGQGYFSLAERRGDALRNKVDIMRHLFLAASRMAYLRPWKRAIRKGLASAYFSRSYYDFQRGERARAFRCLLAALRAYPHPAYLRFALRMLLPRLGTMP